MQTIYRTRSVAWEELGAFTLVLVNPKRRGRLRYLARAPILGPSGEPAPATRPFAIPDTFEVPLATLLDELQAWRGESKPVSPPVAATPARSARSFGVRVIHRAFQAAILLAIVLAGHLIQPHLAPRRGAEAPDPFSVAPLVQPAQSLLASHPHDPRAQLLAGLVAATARLQQSDKTRGEQELQTALMLAQGPWFAGGPPALANGIRAALAGTLLRKGDKAQARAVAQPACSAEGEAALAPQTLEALRTDDLCGDPERNPS